jgi:hypothetical protein
LCDQAISAKAAQPAKGIEEFTAQINATSGKAYPEVTDSTRHFGTDGTLPANTSVT